MFNGFIKKISKGFLFLITEECTLTLGGAQKLTYYYFHIVH